MEGMDRIEKLFIAKELFHRELGKISFEEKIKMLVRLQKVTNDIKSIAGKEERRVWKI